MNKLYNNASGCYDPTAFRAITNVDNSNFDSEKTKKFVRDIFKVCRLYNICVDGELNITDRKTGRLLRRITLYKRKEKGEE